jgi:hypothetical protein
MKSLEDPRPELRLDRIMEAVFLTIYTLLGIRLILALVAAPPDGALVRLIGAVTDPLYGVFSAVLPDPTSDGRYPLALPILLAILLYALIHGLARTMLRRVGRRRAYS